MAESLPPTPAKRSLLLRVSVKRELPKIFNTRTVLLMPHSHQQMPLAHSLLSAGQAAEVYDDGYTLLDINALITGGREGFLAFIITGDSMREDILPGSVVFIDPYREPKNGDTVAVTINGQNCIKIFERSERLYLVPRNVEYEPQEVRSSDELYILGVVKAHLAVHS